MNKFIFCCFAILHFFYPQICWAEEKDTSYTHENDTIKILKIQNQSLIAIEESTSFILQRYSALESTVTALMLEKKDNQPYFIGLASSVFPGMGEFINQDSLQGSILLFSFCSTAATLNHLYFIQNTHKHEIQNELYYISRFIQNGIMTYSTMHAAEKNFQKYHNRTSAMWTGASSMLPGLGQAINSNWWEAGAFLLSWSCIASFSYYLNNENINSEEMQVQVPSVEDNHILVSWLNDGIRLDYILKW